ncbi:hypothetical protein K7432_014418 [Basidiobolus ranarum]|uniref:Uncharacterized protein n=1 Tax=Basidiobolus ranarum TaxID=34480 RepID=A0ABR2VQ25_9FUNG
MDSLLKDFDKVNKKQKTVTSEVIKNVDSVIQQLTKARERISQDPTTYKNTLSQLNKDVKDSGGQISDSNKELHSVLSKYGKSIDKRFKSYLESASNPQAFYGKEKVLNETIAQHFVRQGQFDVGDTFVKEAHMEPSESLKVQFMEMYQILEAIKKHDLEPALNWARRHRVELEKKGSPLEFNLHRLHYAHLLSKKQASDALIYAKLNFGYFSSRHMPEIQRFMCAILFINRLENSPYADLLSNSHWFDIQHAFTRDFCSLLGMPCESPLYISVTVGAAAVPTIIKMATIMKEKKAEWSQQDELPVEIHLVDDVRFHSVFACPVSKEQATEDNPPMMMPCGHVICKESLNKLAKGNSRFKCPYCPSDSMPSQAQRVYF